MLRHSPRLLVLMAVLSLLAGCSPRRPAVPPPTSGAGDGAPGGASAAGGGAPSPGGRSAAGGAGGGDTMAPTPDAPGPSGGVQHLRALDDGLYAITYDRLFHSADGGRTWREIAIPHDLVPYGITDVAHLQGGGLLIAPLDGPLLRSDDGGSHWAPVADVPRAMSILTVGDSVLVAGRQIPAGATQPLPAIYRSADGGRTWQVSSEGFFPGRAGAVARDAADPNVLYAGVGDYDFASKGGGLFKSTDGGSTWVQSSQGLPGWPNTLLADPKQGGHVYAHTNEGLYESDDGAATWRQVPGSLWFATPDGVRASPDSVQGLPPAAVAYDAGSGRLAAAVPDGPLFTAPLGSDAWETARTGLPTLRLSFALPYALSGRAVFRNGRFAGALPRPNLALAVSPDDARHLWALGREIPGENLPPGTPTSFASQDGGHTWLPLPAQLMGPSLALNDSLLLAQQVGTGLVRSTDGGRTWQNVAGAPQPRDLRLDGRGGLWLASERGVYRSADQGLTWRWVGRGLPSQFVSAVSPGGGDATQAVAATEGGVACTRDGGEHWYACGAGLPDPPYRQTVRLARSPGGALFFALDRSGVYFLAGDRWQQLPGTPVQGLQDLVAPRADEVWVSQFWETAYRHLDPVPQPSLLPAPPAEAVGPAWTGPALSGAAVNDLLISLSDANVALAVQHGGSLALTRDGGRTWQPAGRFDGKPLPDIPLPDGRYQGLYGGALYEVKDGAWRSLMPPQGESLTASADPRHPEQLVAVFSNPLIMGGASGILRSEDGGATWSTVWQPPRAPDKPLVRVGLLQRSPADPDTLYASGDVIMVSHDGGKTWQEQGSGAVQAMSADGRLYGVHAYKLGQSADGGQTWQTLQPPAGLQQPGGLLRTGAGDRLFLLGQGPGGLFLSTDGAATWHTLSASLGDPSVQALAPTGDGGWYLRFTNGLLFRLEL